jgi:acetoin utilization deacetylase AcuC-like enzyme
VIRDKELKMRTGWITHELYLWHNTSNFAQIFPPGLTIQPGVHAENPETKRRFRNLVEVSGLLDHLISIKPRYATEPEIARVHTDAYISRIKSLSAESGGNAGGLSPFGQGSFEIARLAAGGAITAVDAVLDGTVDNAYSLARPPGHHALPDSGDGFCLFANAAIAVRHAQAVRGVERVAIVDWDVHHGNGTQAIFYSDPSVLTISVHQDNSFPVDSGGIDENGAEAGVGYNLNIPLPPGCGHGAYMASINEVIVPALERFRPDLIVVACGFDASAVDPLGRMMLTSASYRAMTGQIMAAADRLCKGRVVMTHEGGYSEMYVPYCGLAVLEQMSGFNTNVVDPWEEHASRWGHQSLQPHQAAAIQRAKALVERIRA